MTFWQQLALIFVGTAFSLCLNWLLMRAMFRWKKEQNFPEELHKEIKQLSRDMVVVRGQIKYIEGRLNGKFWKQQEG